MIRVPACDAFDITDVVALCRKDIVVFLVVPAGDLTGGLSGRVDAVLQKLAPCGRVDRIPDLLPAGGCGRDLEQVGNAASGCHVLQDEFGHGGTADVAVANEKYLNHI